MFVGAARRLVANLTVEECLTKRKEGIADGADARDRAGGLRAAAGWRTAPTRAGASSSTRSKSRTCGCCRATVFENMQARFRREQERQAREAELAKERFVRREEAEAERAVACTKLAADEEVRQKRQRTEEQARLEELAVRGARRRGEAGAGARHASRSRPPPSAR